MIQNTQNRDAMAIHLKLDELLRAIQGARTGMVDLEDLSDEQLAHLQQQFEHLGKAHGKELEGPLEAVQHEIDERADETDQEATERE